MHKLAYKLSTPSPFIFWVEPPLRAWETFHLASAPFTPQQLKKNISPKHIILSSLHDFARAVPSAQDSPTLSSFHLTMLIIQESWLRHYYPPSGNCAYPAWHCNTPILCLQFTLLMTRTCLWFPASSSELSPCGGRTAWSRRTAQQGEAVPFMTQAPRPRAPLRQLSNLASVIRS